MLPPGNVGRRHLDIQGLTGLDAFLVSVLPRRWVIRRVARKIIRFSGPPAIPGDLTFSMPQWPGIWEIVDATGSTQQYPPNTEVAP